tara:strand:+ start:347 stop:769 length:423 start_codon:yes stop_codon:yes gene_type:complete
MTISKAEINTMMKELAKTPDEERAIWYGYVANITAFNLQYQENVELDYDFETVLAKNDSRREYMSLGSLMYNIYTNDGNCFLQQKWIERIEIIIDREKRKLEDAKGENQIKISSLFKTDVKISKFKKAGEVAGFDMRGIK